MVLLHRAAAKTERSTSPCSSKVSRRITIRLALPPQARRIVRGGACGGAANGKCELSPERDCGWELIYNRLKSKGQLDKLKAVVDQLDHSKLVVRPAMMSTSRYALESLDEEGK